MELTRVSDPVKDYVEAINNAEDVDQLRVACDMYKEVAWDAKTIVDDMDEGEFTAFRLGLVECKKRKSPGFSWEEKYNAIVLPVMLTMITCVSTYYKVPWGIAYGRLLDAKIIEKNSDGILSPKGTVL